LGICLKPDIRPYFSGVNGKQKKKPLQILRLCGEMLLKKSHFVLSTCNGGGDHGLAETDSTIVGRNF